jgi:hypothetical protein
MADHKYREASGEIEKFCDFEEFGVVILSLYQTPNLIGKDKNS